MHHSERRPRFGEFIRLSPVADPAIQSQIAIGPPRIAWVHHLVVHDMLVRQEPEKAQLGNAAEYKSIVPKIVEPLSGCAMMYVLFRG